MFGDINKLEEMKAKLNSVSPSFCMAKWKHVTIHLMNGHTHSCYLPRTHAIPLEELKNNPSALHNTSYKKEQRRKMLNGERPEECKICWEIEDLPGNQTSDRHWRGIDSWTLPFFDEIRKTPWDANVYPSYVEVSFSSACNFKCSYCSPHVSSKWAEEIKQHGPYQLSEYQHQNTQWLQDNGFMPLEDEDNPYVEAFWKWWPDLVKQMMFFRITGGEPLLSKNTFKVLDWLKENPQANLDLSINSNMGVPERHMDRFITSIKDIVENGKVKNFMLHTSVDTFGEHAEYIRNGLNFKYFDKNINRFLTENPRASVAFMCTFNNLSISRFREFLDWVVDLRTRYGSAQRSVLLDIPHLMGPFHQSVKILTPDYLDRMRELHTYMQSNISDENGFRQAEVEKFGRIIGWMESPSEEGWLKKSRRDFYLYFKEHDRRRGTDFLKTFPQMKDFWEHCKSLVHEK
ncbi:MAG: radical SAM protein [Bdellovibrionales bacterium]|nr:radical SAM protein [Bdellovibrionales bacterium]